MAEASTPSTTGGAKTSASGSSGASWVYDPKVRGLIFQIGLLLSVAFLIYWIFDNTRANLVALDKRTGFDFLGEVAGFQPSTSLGTWAVDYTNGVSTYLDIFLLGVVNTLVVAFFGIIAATVLGFVIGVFRLSNNVVLRGFGAVYVELLRNLPLLLQLFFWYFFVLRLVPTKREEPLELPFGWSVDISGIWGHYPLPQDGFWLSAITMLAALVLWIGLSYWSAARQAATGKQFPVFWVGLGAFILAPVIVFYITGAPLEWEEPVRGRFGFRQGVGMVLSPEMVAVWFALTLYTSAFIAEIVRAGILAVSKGQSEAAHALGLRQQPTLNLIVIPQAMRVIIPPLTSQFLNLTKNSSLAVAIAYPDVVSVFAGTALNQVGQEIEMIFMMMMVYLFFSITISIIMNWYNRRMALVER